MNIDLKSNLTSSNLEKNYTILNHNKAKKANVKQNFKL